MSENTKFPFINQKLSSILRYYKFLRHQTQVYLHRLRVKYFRRSEVRRRFRCLLKNPMERIAR